MHSVCYKSFIFITVKEKIKDVALENPGPLPKKEMYPFRLALLFVVIVIIIIINIIKISIIIIIIIVMIIMHY